MTTFEAARTLPHLEDTLVMKASESLAWEIHISLSLADAFQMSAFSSSTVFPPLHAGGRTSLQGRSLRFTNAITAFARYPDRRPAGLASALDGSLDIHQM